MIIKSTYLDVVILRVICLLDEVEDSKNKKIERSTTTTKKAQHKANQHIHPITAELSPNYVIMFADDITA